MAEKLPNPSNRKEMFLASAAGASVDTPTPITREEIFLDAIANNSGGGGEGGTANYNQLTNKPKINGTELSGDKSLNDIGVTAAITEEVAKIVADAPEDFDTLKEMSDWISEHEDSAAAMNSAIQENTAAISGKVDKVSGKGLSTNDYTTAEKNKLAGLGNYDDSQIKADLKALNDVRKVMTWQDVQSLVRSGRAKNVFGIGDQLVCKKGDTTLVWDVIGIDHDEPTDKQFTHSMTLQLHDCLSATMQYDAPEALYFAETELAAGTYCFTIQDYDATYGGNKTYNFTLTKPVPAGGQITFGWSYQTQAANAKINTYESRTSTTAIETVGVTVGSAGISLGTTDGNSPNVNHIHRVRYGSNNPLENAMRQFLNSDKAAGAVWTPQTNYDRPPSWAASTAGFMNGLDSDFLAVLGKTHKITCLNTVTDGGGSVTQDDIFFLLSRREVFCGNEVASVIEGEPYPYYSDYSDYTSANTGVDKNRIKYRNGTAQTWWLRTPNAGTGSNARSVYTTGILNDNGAYSSTGVAPACNII